MKHRVAFLSTDGLEGYFVYDELAVEPLRARGVEVHTVSWRREDVPWSDYDAVILRSTWDYQRHASSFLATLAGIADAGVPLWNDLDLVRWNLDKRYLLDLQARGVRIVPTQLREELSEHDLEHAFDVFGREQLVVKPTVSANADDTFRITKGDHAAVQRAVETLRGRHSLVQPYVEAIATEGETSLFFFDGAYSHAVLKTPKEGDFRVQEEHGGRLRAVQPPPAMLERARATLDAIASPTLYARVDFVRMEGEDFALMEAELIEPSLYFPYDEGSPGRFADAVKRWLEARDVAPSS